MKYFGIGSLLFIVFAFSACTSDSTSGMECDEEIANVSFSLDIAPIIETYCSFPGASEEAGCHVVGTAAGGLALFHAGGQVIYNGVKLKVDDGSMADRVLNKQNMPPDYTTEGPQTMDLCDLERVRIWIEEGALDN